MPPRRRARRSPRENATIQDVANRAEVSIATVSRVANESGLVADATRERVLRAMEALRYRPSRTAKSLAQGHPPELAVAVPTFTTPFHNELLKGVRSQLEGEEADLLLCDLQWEDLVGSLKNFLHRGAIEGMLVAGLPPERAVREELERMEGPVVLVGQQWDGYDSFHWKEAVGARKATAHLLEQGHQRIGMITTHHESPIRNARVRGYEEALAARSIDPPAAWITAGRTEKHAGFSEESGYEAMQSLLRLDPPVTAVFASSDVQAIGAWKALREEGRAVPDDVALVGYDDIKISRFLGLTSVSQKMHEVGARAIALLQRRLQGTQGSPPVSHLVEPELIPRRSSTSSPHPTP